MEKFPKVKVFDSLLISVTHLKNYYYNKNIIIQWSNTIQSPWIYFLITDLMPSLIKYANEASCLIAAGTGVCMSEIYLIYIDIIYLSLSQPNFI